MADEISALPESSGAAEKALANAVRDNLSVDVPIGDIWNPDTCPAAVLPWLAWALSVDRWDNSWSEETKRNVIRVSIEVHRRKGTVAAVQTALDAQGFKASLLEWHRQQTPGDPYTFKLYFDVDQAGYSKAQLNALLAWVEDVKSMRSHLESANPIVTSAAPAQVIVLPSISATHEVGPATIETANLIDGGVADTDFQFFPTLDGGAATAQSSDHEVNP